VNGVSKSLRQCIATHPFLLQHIDLSVCWISTPAAQSGNRLRHITVDSYGTLQFRHNGMKVIPQFITTLREMRPASLQSFIITGHSDHHNNQSLSITQIYNELIGSGICPRLQIHLQCSCDLFANRLKDLTPEILQRIVCDQVIVNDGICCGINCKHKKGIYCNESCHLLHTSRYLVHALLTERNRKCNGS
jgi:hypothetical protein